MTNEIIQKIDYQEDVNNILSKLPAFIKKINVSGTDNENEFIKSYENLSINASALLEQLNDPERKYDYSIDTVMYKSVTSSLLIEIINSYIKNLFKFSNLSEYTAPADILKYRQDYNKVQNDLETSYFKSIEYTNKFNEINKNLNKSVKEFFSDCINDAISKLDKQNPEHKDSKKILIMHASRQDIVNALNISWADDEYQDIFKYGIIYGTEFQGVDIYFTHIGGLDDDEMILFNYDGYDLRFINESLDIYRKNPNDEINYTSEGIFKYIFDNNDTNVLIKLCQI